MAYPTDSAPTLDELLGIAPPDMPPDYAPQTFQPGPGQGHEFFAGAENLFQQPRGGLESFLSGLTGSLGTAGTKASQAREKFDRAQAERKAAVDAQRLQATKDYSKIRNERMGKLAEENRANTEFNRRETFRQTLNPGTSEPLVAVNTPKGPRLLTRSEAYGREPAKNAMTSELSPEQASLLWGLVQQGGAFPPLGRGGITSPGGQAILNAGLHSPGTAGNPPQTPAEIGAGIAGAKATQQGNAAALRSIETSLAQQTVFTDKLKKNTDRLRAASKKILDLGPRFVNGPVRYAMGQLGSADQAAFNAALMPVVTESSRLLTSGPSLGGQLTDTAQKELRSIVSGDFNLNSLNAVLDILESDAKNGIDSYTSQRDALRLSVGGRKAAPKAALTPSQKRAAYAEYAAGR